jgi:ribonuclease-3
MTSASSVDSLQSSLGYRFKALALLEEALTHSSLVNEQRTALPQHNERLEFLGDAVLSLVISEYLASALPQSSEGTLSKLKAQVVSEASLAVKKTRCWPMRWRRCLRLFILTEDSRQAAR